MSTRFGVHPLTLGITFVLLYMNAFSVEKTLIVAR
jgi:hypothetical protein